MSATTSQHPIRGVFVGIDCSCRYISRSTGECQECGGTKIKKHFVTLEEFAGLFTWGTTIHQADFDTPQSMTHDIRVKDGRR